MKLLNALEYLPLNLELGDGILDLEAKAMEDHSDNDLSPLVSGQGEIVTVQEEEDWGQEEGPWEDLPQEIPYSEDEEYSSEESVEEGNMGPVDWRDWMEPIVPDDLEPLADRIWRQMDWQLRQPLIPGDLQKVRMRDFCEFIVAEDVPQSAALTMLADLPENWRSAIKRARYTEVTWTYRESQKTWDNPISSYLIYTLL